MPNLHAQAEATYAKHLANLQGWSGWFALIQGDRLGGVFPTYEAAAIAWMSMYGPVPALIRRIECVRAVAADGSVLSTVTAANIAPGTGSDERYGTRDAARHAAEVPGHRYMPIGPLQKKREFAA